MREPLTLRLIAFLAVMLLPCGARAQDATDAYMDSDARELVRLARARLNTVDRRIEAYGTTSRERVSISLRAGIAEKLAYRRETVTRIQWERDAPLRMDVLALREVAPLFDAVPAVPDDLSSELINLAFDPADPGMLMRVDTTALRHPLAEGGEAHYRFRSGDTTVIRLPDGRSVRLRELRVIPRERSPRLINGSFWLDMQTHAVVQAYFRLARAYDADEGGNITIAAESESDSGQTRRRQINLADIGFIKPIRADMEYIALEYGLWDLQWWLPRLVTARGYMQINRFRIPLSYERTYEDYTVRGDTAGILIAEADSLPRRCRANVRYVISADNATQDSARQLQVDSARARRDRRDRAAAQSRAERGDTTFVESCVRDVIVSAAPDSVLLNSPELPPAYAGDTELIADAELEAIAERVRSIPDAPWQLRSPRLQWALTGPGLLRYNRVEGLSVGARTAFDVGPGMLEAEARFGFADYAPRGAVAFDRPGGSLHSRIAAYRRLEPVTPSSAHGTFASLGALLLGRDDGQYFDALGSEIVVRPRESRRQWYDARLYAERQRAVERNTNFSIAGLIDSDRDFRENFTADAADQLGARVRLRTSYGRDPYAPRIAGELSLAGETGDYRIVRPEALLTFTTSLVSGVALSLEGAAGTVEGTDVPAQAHWYLGGASTLRGYPGGTLSGERYWRTRAEVGWGVPGARLAVFSDAGWAAPRNRFDGSGALASAGVGASLLDGVFRIDVAHGFSAPGGWRLHVHFSGMD